MIATKEEILIQKYHMGDITDDEFVELYEIQMNIFKTKKCDKAKDFITEYSKKYKQLLKDKKA